MPDKLSKLQYNNLNIRMQVAFCNYTPAGFIWIFLDKKIKILLNIEINIIQNHKPETTQLNSKEPT